MERLTPNNKREKTKKIICVVLVVVAVLGLGGLGGYAIGQFDKDKEVANAREEAERMRAESHSNGNDSGSSTGQPVSVKTATELTCNADELSLAVTPNGEGDAAGMRGYEVALENTSDRTCTLVGYPGVSLVNENGNQIGEPAERIEDAEEETVTLEPGTRALSAMTIPNSDNFPDGECKDGATKLRVYPPNDTGYLSVGTEITTWCNGFSVAPVLSDK